MKLDETAERIVRILHDLILEDHNSKFVPYEKFEEVERFLNEIENKSNSLGMHFFKLSFCNYI
jgi:hypothetical protein